MFLPIRTVGEPIAIVSGGPTQTALSPTRAAGWPPMRTVTPPGGRTGPPTCGTGGVPGVTIGQVCISPTRAAGGILFSLVLRFRQGTGLIIAHYLLDFCPDLDSSATVGSLGLACLGSVGELGLLPLPEPAAPPLLIITIVP